MGHACEGVPRRARRAAALATAALTLLAATSATAQEQPSLTQEHHHLPAAPNTWYTRAAVAALRAMDASDGNLQAAGAAALNSGIADAVGQLSRQGPEWLRRSEIKLRLSDELRPGYDLLTVQPLYQSPSGRDTVVVEGRLAHEAGSERTTGNAGMGYRRLVHDDRILLGASSFYDYEWPYEERRLGLGAEVRSRPLELNAVYYGIVPNDAAAADDPAAEVLNGFDLGLDAQVPYLPWAEVYGERFWKETDAFGGTAGGERFGLRLSPLPPVQVELGGISNDDETVEPTYFARFRFTKVLGGPPPKRAPLVDHQAFAFDDVSALTLDRLRR